MRYAENDEFQSGSLQGGLPTCVFSPKNYHRVITNIVVGNSATSAVKCYRGILGSTPVAQNLLGSNNTLRGTIKIPSGQTFFVQWSALGASVRDAFARVSWERDDNPLVAGGSSGQEWASEAITSFQVPTAALPGEPRLVMGADIPPPLNTYVFNAYGIMALFSAVIVFYARDPGPVLDETYSFIGIVDNELAVGTVLVYGQVHGGVVREYSAGRPAGLTTLTMGAGVTNQINVLYDDIVLAVRAGSTGDISLTSPNEIRLTADDDVDITSTVGDVRIIASDDIVLTADTLNAIVTIANNITVVANSGGITLTALGAIALGSLSDITLSATGVTTSEGDLLGLRNDNECTSVTATANTSSAVYANTPGTNTLSFTKRYADSALLVTYMPTFFVTVSDTGPKFAVAIGGVDYELSKLPATLTAGVRMQACGQKKITGIGAGVVTLTARWGRVAGTGSVNITSGDDWYSFTVQEIAA